MRRALSSRTIGKRAWLLWSIIAAAAAAAVFAANLVWLDRSTLSVVNRGSIAIRDIEIRVCNSTIRMDTLVPGASRLYILPKCGEPLMDVSVTRNSARATVCKLHYQPKMDHVDVRLSNGDASACDHGYPPFLPILVFKAVATKL